MAGYTFIYNNCGHVDVMVSEDDLGGQDEQSRD
jgi:hypothetical protein